MTGGAPQDGRLPDAFAGEMAQVDSTSVEQLLVMSYRLGRRLRMAGGTGHGDTWGRLLEHDESVLIARSQSLAVISEAGAFLDDFAASRPSHVARHIRDLLGWLRAWSAALAGVKRPWAALMRERADRLLEEYKEPDDPLSGDTAALEELRRKYFGLGKELDHLADLAASVWDASLKSQTHEPAASLLIAFCRLSARVQTRANTFADRLVDFYYKDVLRMEPKAPQADYVHLLFQRDPTFPTPVVAPAGTPFVVTRSGARPLTFRADRDLTVTDARVEQLLTLRLQRDELISPDSSFGFVTGAKVARFGPDVGQDGEARQMAAALLGGDARGALPQGEDARFGLAIASPVLWLKEGERRITLSLTFDFGAELVDALIAELQRAADAHKDALAKEKPDEAEAEAGKFREALGRLFARWVMPDRSPWDDEVLTRIRDVAKDMLPLESFHVHRGVVDDSGDGNFDEERYSYVAPLVLMLAEREADYPDDRRRNLIRDEIVENLFRVALSTADGWHEVYRPVLIEDPGAPPSGRHTMTLVMDLANEDPAIVACTPDVHGPEWPTTAPIVRLSVNKHARVFPFSLLEKTVLQAVDIQVQVDGVRDVQAFNQLGPLDTSRPFMPFGPLPDTSTYLVLGSEELARKYPSAVTVHPEWSGLPPRGFNTHYEAYHDDYGASVYRVTPAILRDGVWVGTMAPVRLFDEGAPPQGRPISIDRGELRSRWRPVPGEYSALPTARNGLLRLQLSAPEGGFGHKDYPLALTEVVSANAKDKKRRPLPNPPYTPQLERVTLSYTATARIELSSQGRSGAGQQILHIHPFGLEEIHPGGFDWDYGLVPDVDQDGNLYIGLSGSPPQGPLNLFFDLRRDAAIEALARRQPPPKLRWSYLTADRGWRRLPERRVINDGTSGFLASGVVSLNLPGGLTNESRIMPAGYYWLRLSCDDPSGCFAGLKGVRAQGLRATRVLDEPPTAPLPAGSITLNSAPLPGVIALTQPEPGLDLRPAETKEMFRARVGERLRHKHRASTPWDYERLVLERFDFVQVVRCLANTRDDASDESRPGNVLVIATPKTPIGDARYACRPMRLDPLQLRQIESYLRGLVSPALKLKVRNPSYDLVQVRGRVVLADDADEGDTLRRVNAALISHLSPWRDSGRAVQFDWEIRAEEIDACMRAVRGVRHVKGLSLVQVWHESSEGISDGYFLSDTAATHEPVVRLKARQRWSLALPTEEHFIEVVESGAEEAPRRTGVAGRTREGRSPGVEIGRSFVVDRNS